MGYLSKTVYCINQKGTGSPSYIQSAGCAVCSAGEAASYYAEKRYSIADLATSGLYNGNATCLWTWKITSTTSVGSTYTESSDVTYSTIKNEIDNDRPIIICTEDTSGHTHWVMCYGYSGTGDAPNKIYVADPATGQGTTLEDAISYTFDYYGTTSTVSITRLKTTSKKT